MGLPGALGPEPLAAGDRREAVDEQVLGNGSDALGLDKGSETAGGGALLAGGDEGLLAGVADELLLGGGGAAEGQQADGVALGHVAGAGVGAADVAAPVGVVGDVAGGGGDGIVVAVRVVGSRRGVPEVRVQRHAVGAVRIDGEGAADALPDAGGLEGLFLYWREGGVVSQPRISCRGVSGNLGNLGNLGGRGATTYMADGHLSSDGSGSFRHRLGCHDRCMRGVQ